MSDPWSMDGGWGASPTRPADPWRMDGGWGASPTRPSPARQGMPGFGTASLTGGPAEEDINMAAITSAIIGGGSVIANMWGQHKGRQSAEKQFDKAERLATDELAYNMGQQYQAWEQAVPRMRAADQAHASVMANVGIPGLAQYNVPPVPESAYAPPPRTPEELRAMRQRPGGQASRNGYMSGADYGSRQATGPVNQVGVFEEEAFIEPPPRRPANWMMPSGKAGSTPVGTMGGLLPNRNT